MLTRRQEDIVRGLVDGLQAKEIASRQHATVDSIRWQIRTIAARLPPEYRQISATQAVVRWAFRSGKWSK